MVSCSLLPRLLWKNTNVTSGGVCVICHCSAIMRVVNAEIAFPLGVDKTQTLDHSLVVYILFVFWTCVFFWVCLVLFCLVFSFFFF